jgi:hypothetical protein
VKVSDVTLTLFAWTDIPSTQYSRSRSTTLCAIGAMHVALWDVAGKVRGVADPPTAGRLPRSRRRLRQLGRARLEAGVRAGGVALQGPRMDRLQEVHADQRSGSARRDRF